MPEGAISVAPLVCATVAVILTAGIGALRPRAAGPLAAIMAIITFGVALVAYSSGSGGIDVPWAPSLNLRLAFTFDGLAALYTLLASGIGIAVLAYALRYLPLHLHHEGRPPAAGVRFYAFLLLFMAAMLGMVAAQDLILLFLFWDVTAIASYFLIGFDQFKPEARASALMAFLVTGVSSILFIIGAAILYADYGTFSLPALIEQVEPSPRVTTAAALIAVAGLAKSAQVPFHFWLPRAMVAPTPVSAYLHSAAMVAAGVFLLGRMYPIIATSQGLLDALLAIGLISMAVGGVLALSADVLKQVLAYSTIAQYGYVVTMFGLGGEAGVVAASFYVIAHGLIKSALFLTAGAVTEVTGQDRLSRVGGLLPKLPLLGIASGVCAAGLAALPLTIGFFKDELFFEAALARGPAFAALAVAGAALTVAYMWHFWAGIFLGPERCAARPAPALLTGPVIGLGLLVLIGGIVPEPVATLAERAATAGLLPGPAPEPVSLGYHLDTRPANLLALATYALGIAVIATRRWWSSGATWAANLGARFGPERIYAGGLAGLNRFSASLLRLEVRDLRGRITSVLVPAAALMALGFLVAPIRGSYQVGAIGRDDLVLVLFLSLVALASVAATRPRAHLMLALSLSAVGFSLAAVYGFLGAPDVALVAVLIETLMTLLLLGVLTLFPRPLLNRAVAQDHAHAHRWRDPIIGVVAGIFAFVVAWSALSRPASVASMATIQTELTPLAHARDVVTAILADFRGFDTAGEITVIALAMIGVLTYLRRARNP